MAPVFETAKPGKAAPRIIIENFTTRQIKNRLYALKLETEIGYVPEDKRPKKMELRDVPEAMRANIRETRTSEGNTIFEIPYPKKYFMHAGNELYYIKSREPASVLEMPGKLTVTVIGVVIPHAFGVEGVIVVDNWKPAFHIESAGNEANEGICQEVRKEIDAQKDFVKRLSADRPYTKIIYREFINGEGKGISHLADEEVRKIVTRQVVLAQTGTAIIKRGNFFIDCLAEMIIEPELL